jgi:hypothetical protein
MSTRKKSVLQWEVATSLALRAGRAVAAALGLVLMPKCPLCVAAYLIGFGLSSSAAALAAPLMRPAVWVLVAASGAGLVYGVWERRAQRRRQTAELARAGDACGCD